MLKTTNTTKWFIWVMAAALTACSPKGSKGTDESEGETKGDAKGQELAEIATPSDTKGGNGSVSLTFGAQTGFALAEEAAPSVTLENGYVLTRADFSIDRIKVKSPLEASEKEKQNDALEEEEDAVETQAVETAEMALKADAPASEVGAEKSADAAGQAEKPEAEERRAKLAAMKEELQAQAAERLAKQQERDKSMRWTGPYVYDAIKGELVGDAPTVDLADGSYHRVEFKLRRNWTAEDTDALLGNVFVIQGKFKKGDADVAFEIEHGAALNFKLKGEEAFEVLASAENKLSVVFDLAAIFKDVDLAAAKADQDGVVRISHRSNKELHRQIILNMMQATRFGKDKDGDGKIKEDETAGVGSPTDAETAME